LRRSYRRGALKKKLEKKRKKEERKKEEERVNSYLTSQKKIRARGVFD